MSSSDDEDDFLSADEDEFTCNDDHLQKSPSNVVQTERASNQPLKEQPSCTIPKKLPINKVIDNSEAVDIGGEPTSGVTDSKTTTKSEEPKLETGFVATTTDTNTTSTIESKVEKDEDDEEALAERIRERNLKIARKFSAELAKNVKASAPIPVKLVPPPVDLSSNEFQNSPSQPNSPRAPPPTPALSSSFNNNDSPSTMAAVAAAANTISQYGWRIPARSSEPKLDKEPPEPSKMDKNDQARLALDRLSEKLSKPEKNLFEMVAEDIKKVTLKPTIEGEEAASTSALPSISDLGNMLGGWGWNSANQLIASASTVTSQMGSMIDSVVQAAQPGHPQAEDKETYDKKRS